MSQLKIGLYKRVSTEEAALREEGSLDNQEYRLRAFVKMKNAQEPNWGDIVDVYTDGGFSAKDTNRPAFQKMMRDLSNGKIDLILVADLSRLSRSLIDFCDILEVLKKNNSSFLSIKEQFDTSTPVGKMIVYIVMTLAQFEREQTAERVALGCHSRAMRGLLNGGLEILGYNKSPEKKNTYVVNELEAEQVRTIFKTFLELGTINRTAAKLEELGIGPKIKKNRKEKLVERGLWTQQSLGGLLKNHAYIGKYEVNRKYKNANQKTLRPYQKYQIVTASWPGIVDEGAFESVQNLLEENKLMERRRLEGAERRIFLASGIIKCKECGRSMVGHSAHGEKNVHRYYKHAESKGDVITCSVKRIRAEEVEDAITHHITKVLLQGNYLDEVTKKMVSEDKSFAKSAGVRTSVLRKELKEVEQEMENVFKFQMRADPSSQAGQFLIEKIETLGNKKSNLLKQIESYQEEDSNVVSLDEVRHNLGERVSAISRGWSKLSAAQQKRSLRRLIQQLNIGPGVIDIYYYGNALSKGETSGSLSVESDSDAKVLPFTKKGASASKSKLLVQNCLSTKLATPDLGWSNHSR